MISGTCHCGAVSFQLHKQPEWLTECNCSICRRIGALWAHAEHREIKIICEEGATERYIWGDQSIAFHSCKVCGCTSHWENLQATETSRMAVNLRMSEPAAIAGIPIRHFDGAESWTFLD
jgi:hypothetical protein